MLGHGLGHRPRLPVVVGALDVLLVEAAGEGAEGDGANVARGL